MGLFSKHAQAADPPPFTLFAGDSPRLPAVKSALATGFAANAVAEIRMAPADERFELIWSTMEMAPYPYLKAQPGTYDGDSFLATYAGVAAIASGWRVRTNATADHVDASQFDSFFAWLNEAEEHLWRAVTYDQADATPWVGLLTSGRGLQRGRAHIEQVFTQLVARDPHHLEGHRQMLQWLCNKWFGSHDEMFAFARSVSASAPEGSPLHELLLMAHVERWVDFSVHDPGELALRQGYMSDPSVRAEVSAAAARLGPLLTGPPDGRSITARNILAFIAWCAGDAAGFTHALDLMQGVVSETPWDYYRDPVQMVRECWSDLART